MNKRRIKSASKLLKSVFDDSVKAEDLLYGILDADLRDCRNALERSQLKESLEEEENQLLETLWRIAFKCQMAIKKIDKETLREYQRQDQYKIDFERKQNGN